MATRFVRSTSMVMENLFFLLSFLCGVILQSSVQSMYEFTGVVRHLREARRGRFRIVRSRMGESVTGYWDRDRRRVSSVLKYHSFIRLSCETRDVYYLPGKTVWSTAVVNGTRGILNGNFHGDVLVPFPRLFLGRKDQSKP